MNEQHSERKGIQGDPVVRDLIAAAAEAIERFSEDDLEASAEKMAGAPTWKSGLPPGKYYAGMENDFEVYYSPGGKVWHRRKTSKLEAFTDAEVAHRMAEVENPTDPNQ